MKRILVILPSLGLVILGLSLIYTASPDRPPGRVDPARLLVAAQAYADNLKAQNLPEPASVSLDELIARKLVAESDVSGFAGMEVTVSLNGNKSRPQEMLIRVGMADGREIAALADGSVQTR